MDREACHTAVQCITKSCTQLSNWTELLRGNNMKNNRYLYLYQTSWNVKDADGDWFWPSKLQSTEAWSLPQPKTLNEHVCKFKVLVSLMSDSLQHPGPPGSSVCGILQARILECIATPSSGDLPHLGIEPGSSAMGRLLTVWATTEA